MQSLDNNIFKIFLIGIMIIALSLAVQSEEAVEARPDVDGRRRRHAQEVGGGARAGNPRQDAGKRLQVQELRRPPRPLAAASLMYFNTLSWEIYWILQKNFTPKQGLFVSSAEECKIMG